MSGHGNRERHKIRMFKHITASLPDAFVKLLLRIPLQCFETLSCKLYTFLDADAGNENIKLRLLLTIRLLAGASYLDLTCVTGMSKSTVYKIIDCYLQYIDRMLHISIPFRIAEFLREASIRFSRGEGSPLNGCFGALDGLTIKIKEPSLLGAPIPASYFNRKGFFAVNMQAMCDHLYRFIFVSLKTPSSSHDSMAFQVSALAEFLKRKENCLPLGRWVVCDNAYVCGEKLLAPWSGRQLSIYKDCFNFWLSFARIMIEQAFGIVLGTCGILWRPLKTSLSTATHVVAVCCKLHTFIMDEKHSTKAPQNLKEDVCSGTMNVMRQDEFVEGEKRRRDLETSTLRDIFTDETEDMQQYRYA